MSASEGSEESGRKEARETSTTPPVKVDETAQATGKRRPKEPVGLGGWLILPMLGLLITFVFGLVFIFVDAIPALGADTWSRIPTSGRAVFTLEFFVQLVGIVAAAILLVLVFMRSRVLPKLAVAFYVFVLLAVLADSIATLIVGAKLIPDPELRAEVGLTGGYVATRIVIVILTCALWIPYFLISRRVKNTFIRQPAPEAGPQPDAAVPQPDTPDGVSTFASQTASAAAMNKSRVFRRWSIGVALSVTVAVLAVLIWNCAAPPGTSESAASGFSAPTGSVGASATKTYVDPECGYSFDYPASWRLDPQTDALGEGVLSSVMVFDPQGTGNGEMSYTVLLVQVEDSGPTFTESMLPGIQTNISTSVAELTQSGEVQVVVPVAAIEVGRMKGFSVTLRDSGMDPSTTSSMYYLYRGTRVYTLGVQAAETDWEKNQAVFENFIGTFEPAD